MYVNLREMINSTVFRICGLQFFSHSLILHCSYFCIQSIPDYAHHYKFLRQYTGDWRQISGLNAKPFHLKLPCGLFNFSELSTYVTLWLMYIAVELFFRYSAPGPTL